MKNGLYDIGILSFVFTPLAGLPLGLAGLLRWESACILAGVVFGAAGLVRRERLRWLSVIGLTVTLCIIGGTVIYAVYFDLDG